MKDAPITIKVPVKVVTLGAGVWKQKEYNDWIACVTLAVRDHPERERLARWIQNTKGRLAIEVDFFLPQQNINADLDNMVGTIFNPVVRGACGMPPRSGPERRDAIFWKAIAEKHLTTGASRVEIRIYPIPVRVAKEALTET